MKFKHLLLTVTLFMTFSFLTAQYGGCDSFSSTSERFKGTKTLVVLTGDKKFDENFKLGLEAYWKVTSYEFIKKSEVNSKISNPKYSIIMPISLSITDNVSTQEYPIMGVLVGGKESVSSYSYNSLVAYNVIDNFGLEKSVEKAGYRAKNMVKLLHDYIQLKLDGKVRVVCATLISGANKYYNGKSGVIKSKTLLVSRDQLRSLGEDTFKKSYQGDFKIVSKSELEKEINASNSKYCMLLPVFTRHKNIYVVDLGTGEIVYADYSTYGMKLKKSDVKSISSAVAKSK